MELVNRLVVEEARLQKIEKGRKVRVDCTVVDSNIHHPSDSSLLFDCVRVLARVMEQGYTWLSLWTFSPGKLLAGL